MTKGMVVSIVLACFLNIMFNLAYFSFRICQHREQRCRNSYPHLVICIKISSHHCPLWGWESHDKNKHPTNANEDDRMKAIATDPHHPPVWQSITKDIVNVGKSTREILKIVVDTLKYSYSCNIHVQLLIENNIDLLQHGAHCPLGNSHKIPTKRLIGIRYI